VQAWMTTMSPIISLFPRMTFFEHGLWFWAYLISPFSLVALASLVSCRELRSH
jgi:hypothetical protein